MPTWAGMRLLDGAMRIWPAIDLCGGKCVRLRQGDFRQQTTYGDDPVAMARRWVEAGAPGLHLVDLDGARQGVPGNLAAIEAILHAVAVPCQVGGGIREEATIRQLLDAGAARVIVGTRALRDLDWLKAMAACFPGRLVLGVDARDGWVATDGWLATARVRALELVRPLADVPLAAVCYTDIARDGMLQGPNLAAMEAMRAAWGGELIASGGVTTADDVRALAALGVDGCIIGKALYEGRLDLKEALAAAAPPAAPP